MKYTGAHENDLTAVARFALWQSPVDPRQRILLSVRARPRRLRAHCDFHRESILCGAFVWARRALNDPKRWFLARAVLRQNQRRWATRGCAAAARAVHRRAHEKTTQRTPTYLSGPAGGGQAPLAFFIVNRVWVARLYRRMRRLTAQNGGPRPARAVRLNVDLGEDTDCKYVAHLAPRLAVHYYCNH
jgi:hypothetical protein